jgi:Mce-associated membrane protein
LITDARRNGSNLDDMTALAEQAEADAAEAEAHAAAVRARARAIRARQRIRDLDANETTADSDSTADSPSVETSEPEVEPFAPPKRRWFRRLKRPSRSAALRGAAVLMVIAALSASGLVYWQHHQVVNERQRAAEFAAAAREGVMALTSLDFAKSKEDVQRVLDNATGAFKADFQKRADDFGKIVEESKVVARGNVYATAVESMTKDSAVVLVAATSEVTGPDGAKGKPRAWRLEVTVARDGDRLKMSKVEFVQ